MIFYHPWSDNVPSLEQYLAFVQTADRGSLTAAAKHLGCSLQSVSRALAALEDELGIELIRRTTRRMQLSPAGLVFHQRIKAALADIEHACAEASHESARIGGLFRVGASVMFAPNYVAPAVVGFLQRFPDLEIELVLADSVADLIAERLDVAIRIGDLSASSLKVRRLANLRRVVVASPIYLARHGEPRVPSDLARHACVVRTSGPEGDSWPMTIGGKPTNVAVRGTLRCNDAASANAAVVLGAGLGLAPLWQVRADLDQGRLGVVLAEFEPPSIPVQAVWPGNAGTPAKTRLFVDTIAAKLAAERL